MKKIFNTKMVLVFWCSLVSLLCLVEAGFAATISGTVTNATGRSGRVYLYLQSEYGNDIGIGVSVAAPQANKSFTIRGIPAQRVRLKAFVDGTGMGKPHANDPVWESSNVIDLSTSPAYNGPDSSVTFSSIAPTAPVAPSSVNILPGNGGAFISWDQPKNTTGIQIADSYKVYYSTTSQNPKNSPQGTIQVKAGENAVFAIVHENDGLPLNVQVTALVGTTESAASSVASAVMGSPAGGVTVSGTISLGGISNPSGTLYVAVALPQEGPRYIAFVTATPGQSNSYSVSGVQPGTYVLYPFIDMNNNGTLDSGDQIIRDSEASQVTVGNSNVTQNVTLQYNHGTPYLRTIHSQDQSGNDSYSLELGLDTMVETPADVTIISGPTSNGLAYPIDIGYNNSNGGLATSWLNVTSRPVTTTDVYSLAITYANSAIAAESATLPVTTVLDSFPALVSPVGLFTYPMQNPLTFSWNNPANPPSSFTYSFWINVSNLNGNYWGLPSTTQSVTLSDLNLSDGQQYDWNVSIRDSNGNQATKSARFTTTTSPVITSFTPASGKTGDNVTITGFNFDAAIPTNNLVSFSGQQGSAMVISSTATQLVVQVPAGAPMTDFIRVTVNSKTGTSTQQFTTLDSTVPWITGFFLPATSSSLVIGQVSINAQDNIGVDGYYISENPAAPSATAAGWLNTPPTTITASKAGSVTFYAWVKDAAGNISSETNNQTVQITLTDTAAPTVDSFALPATSGSLAVAVTTFTASDAVGVSGYMITETATAPLAGAPGWLAAPPQTVAASSAGNKTFYAWAKDAAGNVSLSKSAAILISGKAGDCDYNGTVTIAEVQSAINMFLGLKTVAACVDTTGDDLVSIAEVQKTINSFLGL